MFKVKFEAETSEVVAWLLKTLRADPISLGDTNRSGYRTNKQGRVELVFSVVQNEVWFKHENDTVMFTLTWGSAD